MADPSIPKKVVEDFQDVHFSCVAAEGRIVNSNINASLVLWQLVCYLGLLFEVGDVDSGMTVGHTVLVNCTGDVTTVFFNSYSTNICWILLCRKGNNFLLDRFTINSLTACQELDQRMTSSYTYALLTYRIFVLMMLSMEGACA